MLNVGETTCVALILVIIVCDHSYEMILTDSPPHPITNVFLFALICSLPKSVRRRIKALKKLQYNMVKLESKFYEEVHQLECKYADLYAPILEQVILLDTNDLTLD